jgi:hypothetical protein
MGVIGTAAPHGRESDMRLAGGPVMMTRSETRTRYRTKRQWAVAVVGLSLLTMAASACSTLVGAGVGAGSGAAIGAGVDGGRGAKKGALIGAGVGAAAGTLYGISR